jgi:hypothetical protein
MDEFAVAEAGSIQPNTHSFVVKVWLNDHLQSSRQVTWRGRITHVPSGRCHYFSKLADTADFITLYLQQLGVRPTLRSRVRRMLSR